MPGIINLSGRRPAPLSVTSTVCCTRRLLCCSLSRSQLTPLTANELDRSHSLYQLNELLQEHSAPASIHTLALVMRKLAYMGSDSPKGFKMLAMHDRVLELCDEVQGSVSQVIGLEDASDILGSLEDLVHAIEELSTEHGSIQVHPCL